MIMRKREIDGEIAIHSYRGRLINRLIRNGRKYKKKIKINKGRGAKIIQGVCV